MKEQFKEFIYIEFRKQLILLHERQKGDKNAKRESSASRRNHNLFSGTGRSSGSASLDRSGEVNKNNSRLIDVINERTEIEDLTED